MSWIRQKIPKKAVVISNCQCLPLASWLTTLSAETIFDFWPVHVVAPDGRDAVISAFVAKAKAEYDLIITIPLSDDFGPLASPRIAATFAKLPVVSISNIYFSGLHPDLTYIGGLSERVVGPLSDYHSRLALFGFLRGINLKQTKALFRGEIYRQAGFYEEFNRSITELAERDRNVDVPVSSIIQDCLKKYLCFFSVNHPTSFLISAYCDLIIHHLESQNLGRRSGLPADPSVCAESLASSVIYPIYPEIAAHHGVPQLGSYAFKKTGIRINPIDLDDFLAEEFDVFSKTGAKTLQQSHIAQEMAVRFKTLAA